MKLASKITKALKIKKAFTQTGFGNSQNLLRTIGLQLSSDKAEYLNKNFSTSTYFTKGLEFLINSVTEAFKHQWKDANGEIIDDNRAKIQFELLNNPLGEFTIGDFMAQFVKQKVMYKMVVIAYSKGDEKVKEGLQILDAGNIEYIEVKGGEFTKVKTMGLDDAEGEEKGYLKIGTEAFVHIDNTALDGMTGDKIYPMKISTYMQGLIDIEINLEQVLLLALIIKYKPSRVFTVSDGVTEKEKKDLKRMVAETDQNSVGGVMVTDDVNIKDLNPNTIDTVFKDVNEMIKNKIFFALGVPNELIEGLPAGFSGIAILNTQRFFYKNTINPILDAFVELWNVSIRPVIDPKSKIELTYKDTSPVDRAGIVSEGSRAYVDGVLTANEYREMLGLKPLEDGDKTRDQREQATFI